MIVKSRYNPDFRKFLPRFVSDLYSNQQMFRRHVHMTSAARGKWLANFRHKDGRLCGYDNDRGGGKNTKI